MDFADDLCLAAELLELLVPVLEVMATEAVSFGLEVYCQKQWIRLWTYIHHSSWTSQGGRGLYVPCCSYALIISQQPRHSLKWSTYPYRHARPRQAVLEITNFKISEDEIILHVVPIFLYGSECWAIIIKSVCLVILHLWMMLLMQGDSLEALGYEWHYSLQVVQARNQSLCSSIQLFGILPFCVITQVNTAKVCKQLSDSYHWPNHTQTKLQLCSWQIL